MWLMYIHLHRLLSEKGGGSKKWQFLAFLTFDSLIFGAKTEGAKMKLPFIALHVPDITKSYLVVISHDYVAQC